MYNSVHFKTLDSLSLELLSNMEFLRSLFPLQCWILLKGWSHFIFG